MMQAALAPFRWAIGVVRRWDSLTTCALSWRILPTDSCRVTCTCASVKVKKRVGVCVGVTYCPECFESLRRADGTLPPEWNSSQGTMV